MGLKASVWNTIDELQPGQLKNRAPLERKLGSRKPLQHLVDVGHSSGLVRPRLDVGEEAPFAELPTSILGSGQAQWYGSRISIRRFVIGWNRI